MPKQERSERFEPRDGSWTNVSTLLFWVAQDLHVQIEKSDSGINTTHLAWAVFPMLTGGLEAFVVEYDNVLKDPNSRAITHRNNSFVSLLSRYRTPADLREEATLLWEIRDEIIHPIPLPLSRGCNNTPEALRPLKERGLFESANRHDGEYGLIWQLGSKRLVRWALVITGRICALVVSSDPAREPYLRWMAEQMVSTACSVLHCQYPTDLREFALTPTPTSL